MFLVMLGLSQKKRGITMIDKTKQVIMFAIGTILIVGFFLPMGFS
ncbi:hypothetical protein ACQ7BN_01900 [Streptococcus suis]